MRNIFALFTSIVVTLLTFMAGMINEDESVGFFLMGIVIGCCGIIISSYLVRLIAKNEKAMLVITTLIHLAISLYFIVNIITLLSLLELVAGIAVGVILGTLGEIIACYMILFKS